MELQRLAKTLTEKIKVDYPDDVAIVCVYGSYLSGTAHALSDLDIYFVPKTQRGTKLGFSFILEGIGCDFWGVSWERLEHIAAQEEAIASILTAGQVIYYSTQEDLARFEGLRQQALDTSDLAAYHHRAGKALDEAYKAGFLIQTAPSLPQLYKHAVTMIYHIAFALSQLNRVTIVRIRKWFKDEILAMPLVPDNFSALYDTIFTGDMPEVKAACTALLQNTAALLHRELNGSREPAPFAETMHGWYEEMIQSYNKIYHACQTGDIYTPLYAAAELTMALEGAFETIGIAPELPDLLAAYDSTALEHIAAAARRHQLKLEALLREYGVIPLAFDSLEALEVYLNNEK